ncbi:tyrosine-type recombinase/integrase [Gracilibacillus oryzae]|uniref:Tyrosine-type recombinase/integrase n=1 Tax=Gracilibacillus oryzae TaxID=1672701 RepID=A0A7C8KWY8_9BACI|nr:tyrosine-type recombinase/integrase [Gracilibacillus oryzae]KAB8138534.1 tyrosine-type recombinase/integrase [Gracilibacillus oryzae]
MQQINNLLTSNELIHNNTKSIVIDYLLKDDMIEELQIEIYKNEEQHSDRFYQFNDLQMIYYFIHRQQHVNKAKKLTELTKRNYLRDILQFYRHWVDFQEGSMIKESNQLLARLEPRHVEYYQVNFLSKQMNYKVATIARKTIVLKSFLKWLHQVDYLKRPVHHTMISASVSTEDQPDRDLSYQEVAMLINYWKEKKHPINYPILVVLATTGLRITELCKANWGDLFFDYTTGHYFLSSIGKNKKHRDVLIFPYVLEALKILRRRRRLPEQLNPNDRSPLLANRSQTFYESTYLSKYVKKIIFQTNFPFLMSKNGPITPHWFRHFFANHSLDNGANLEYIRQTLGHSMLKTTQGYLRKNMERKNNAALFWDQHHF